MGGLRLTRDGVAGVDEPSRSLRSTSNSRLMGGRQRNAAVAIEPLAPFDRRGRIGHESEACSHRCGIMCRARRHRGSAAAGSGVPSPCPTPWRFGEGSG